MDKVMMETLNKIGVSIAEFDKVDRISSGSLTLDQALGGGWPKGRFSLIHGWESTGKTTLATLAAAEVIRQGGNVAYFDVECAYDPDWAVKLGVDPAHFALLQPDNDKDYQEAILQDVIKITESGVFHLVILDSFEGLAPKTEMEGDLEDNVLGTRARVNSKFFRLLRGHLMRSKTIFIGINQLREKIGVFMGDPSVIPGGKAQKFYASVNVRMLTPEKIDSQTQLVGMKLRGKTIKNKTYFTAQEFDIDLRFSPFYGVDKIAELFDLGKLLGIFRNRQGEPYKTGIAVYSGIELGRSELEIKAKLDACREENPELVVSLERDVRAAMQR